MVEIIPKKIEQEMPFKNIFLFTAGAFLLAAVFGYVALLRMEADSLLAIQDLEEGIFKISGKENKKNEADVFDAGEKIKNFNFLRAGRSEFSEFFDNFEALIHPRVWFTIFEFNPAEIKAVVSGKSADFTSLEQQLIFLKSKSDIIESFDLSGVSLGEEEEVDFNLTINFTPKILETLKEE